MRRRRSFRFSKQIPQILRGLNRLVTNLNRLMRSQGFRQFLAAAAPFAATLLHVMMRYYGLQ